MEGDVIAALSMAINQYKLAQRDAAIAAKEQEELKIKQMMLAKAMQPSAYEQAQIDNMNYDNIMKKKDMDLKERKQTMDEKLNEASLLTGISKRMSPEETVQYTDKFLPNKKVVNKGWGWNITNEDVVEKSREDLTYDEILLNPTDPKSVMALAKLTLNGYKPYRQQKPYIK